MHSSIQVPPYSKVDIFCCINQHAHSRTVVRVSRRIKIMARIIEKPYVY
jgi:hypothetical protein